MEKELEMATESVDLATVDTLMESYSKLGSIDKRREVIKKDVLTKLNFKNIK